MAILHETYPEAFLKSVQDRRFRTLVIDFDHTFFLGNTTELFIDNTWPRGVAWCLSVLGERAARLFSRDDEAFRRWRDFFRVRFVLIGLPWSYWWWKRQAPSLAAQRFNHSLAEALGCRADAKIIVASLGFRQLIVPLLASSQIKSRLVASSLMFPTINLRVKGKVAALTEGEIQWTDVLAISDSMEDMELLNCAACGHRIEWPAEPLRSPAYFPLRFTVNGKFTPRLFVRQHLQQDLAVICLAYFGGLAMLPALLLAYVSLSVIYEIGYYENDHYSAHKETSSNLHAGSVRFQKYDIHTSAWIWTAGMVGLMGSIASWRLAGLWLGLLILLRLTFYVYNRRAPANRLPLYGMLQGIKYFGYGVIFPLSVLGACLLGAQGLRQILNYGIYRIFGKQPALPFLQIRLGIFVVLVLVGLLATGGKMGHELSSPRGVAILVWICFMAWAERVGGIYPQVRVHLSRLKQWLLTALKT